MTFAGYSPSREPIGLRRVIAVTPPAARRRAVPVGMRSWYRPRDDYATHKTEQ